MGPREDRLERSILALFKQACRAGQAEAAEHLLRALESLDRKRPARAQVDQQSVLAEAYRTIAAPS